MLYNFSLKHPEASTRVLVQSPANFQIKEKDIEVFFAAHLNEIILEDQLMLIGQERAMQEEADLLALDRSGRLYIFELKRWQSKAENLLQVLRYGQIFGRYKYEALQSLAKRHQKLDGDLREKHKLHFELDDALTESAFNHDQVFVIITNGIDHDTLEAIQYWKNKGIKIDSLTYRFYKTDTEPLIWFDVYNPDQDVIFEENPEIFCINTNVTYMADAWSDMLRQGRVSAYYDRKYAVSRIPKGSTIYLYHTGNGIIAKGKTTNVYQKGPCDGNPDEEFYVPVKFEWKLDNPQKWKDAVKAWEINNKLGAGYRFRQTCFGISKEFAETIDSIYTQKQTKY